MVAGGTMDAIEARGLLIDPGDVAERQAIGVKLLVPERQAVSIPIAIPISISMALTARRAAGYARRDTVPNTGG